MLDQPINNSGIPGTNIGQTTPPVQDAPVQDPNVEPTVPQAPTTPPITTPPTTPPTEEQNPPGENNPPQS